MNKKIITSEVEMPSSEATMLLAKPKTERPHHDDIGSATIDQDTNYKRKICCKNVIILATLHPMALYGFYLTFTEAKIATIVCGYFIGYLSAFGVSAGSHRLWSHRSYKATLPMRIVLMLMNTIANQGTIYDWVRDHRVHHKYTDTAADPYNSRRGLFFSHMGWVMLTKHPNVKKFGKQLDLSDLTADPVVVFQMKYYLYIMLLVSFIIPTWIPMYFWNETFKVSFLVTIYRYILSLHMVWCTNSISHWWGYKPYDKSSTATDNPYTGIMMVGESWHNYHHAFPWDYAVPEVPFYTFHPTGKFIEFLALFGLTYDLKSVSMDLAMKQARRKGDGTFTKAANLADTKDDNYSHNSSIWGWDDVNMKSTDRSETEIHN